MRSVIVLLLFLLSHATLAEEQIRHFHSDIMVLQDGSMQVTETIEVNAENKNINRGIYRDFPTRYKDRFGNNYVVDFTITGVSRNGVSEPYHTENKSNGVRIYIGDKNRLVSRGVHTYRIRYTSNRQLGFFDEHDELYWNVTGNDWAFPIVEASARVKLPADIPASAMTATAYTGIQGSKAQDYTSHLEYPGTAFFRTTTDLPPRHGLTIVVGWPKGYVTEPSRREKLGYLLADNSHLLAALAGLVIILMYYLLMWHRVGRDPDAGVIIPLYEPPAGYSPAAMRFIEKMNYDHSCFAAAIVNLAVKGYLKITQHDDDFILSRTDVESVDMAAGESALIKTLLKHDRQIELKQENHQRVRQGMKAQETSLSLNYEKLYFLNNTAYFIVGLVLTLVVLIVSMLSVSRQVAPESLFLLVWLTFWSFGVFMLIRMIITSWKNIRNNIYGIPSALFITAFALPFFAAEFFVIYHLGEMVSFTLIGIMLGILLLNWLFYEWLKAPTLAGRKLLDKAEGFRLFLELAEKEELAHKHPLGRTPALFEAYLPFAIALGVEQEWGEHFTDVLQQASVDNEAYAPRWYHGDNWSSANISKFTHSVGSSLSSAIASSSSPPGSSSGGGGGGFSGGGGGGGGGGGW